VVVFDFSHFPNYRFPKEKYPPLFSCPVECLPCEMRSLFHWGGAYSTGVLSHFSLFRDPLSIVYCPLTSEVLTSLARRSFGTRQSFGDGGQRRRLTSDL
jgi:hypothetical protein